MIPPRALIFTDLDGTLLDHENYDWTPAQPLLNRLQRARVPVVLASSKTAAEMVPLRRRMGLQDYPLICENGAGVICGQGGQPQNDTAAYDEIRTALDRVDPSLRGCFEGFGDMTVDRIAGVTGLPLDDARLAAQRAFSEPGLWHGDQPQQGAFVAAVARQGVAARMGGRFLTLSHGKTKADRMAEIAPVFGNPTTIALGDAPNDVEMLEQADYGIVIINAHGAALPIIAEKTGNRIRRSTLPGPSGWSASLAALLSELAIEI